MWLIANAPLVHELLHVYNRMHHEMQALNPLLPIEPKLCGHIATNCPCVHWVNGCSPRPRRNWWPSLYLAHHRASCFFFGFGYGITPCSRPGKPWSSNMTSPFLKWLGCGPHSFRIRVSLWAPQANPPTHRYCPSWSTSNNNLYTSSAYLGAKRTSLCGECIGIGLGLGTTGFGFGHCAWWTFYGGIFALRAHCTRTARYF